jgi:hypothetical protein
MKQCISSPKLRSLSEAMKVAAWVDQLMLMDECELSAAQLKSIRQRWKQGSPEAPEMILDQVEESLLLEFNGHCGMKVQQ